VVPYEVTYIIDSGLSEEAIPKVVERYSEHVSKNGGQVVNIDNWGKRRLAFEVKGKFEGIYITMRFNCTIKVSQEMRRVMGIDEELVRSMIVRVN
jgi:small subunit ribosomal protein S6